MNTHKRFSADSIMEPNSKKQFNTNNIKWIEKSLDNPNSFPRKNHSSINFGDQLLVYGGKNQSGIILNDLVSFHLSQLRWLPATQNLGSPPAPLYCHTFCVQESRNILYVLGGYTEEGKPNTDVYSQDLSECSETTKQLQNIN